MSHPDLHAADSWRRVTWIDLRLVPAACGVWAVTLAAPWIASGLLAACAAGCALVAVPVARYGRQPVSAALLTVLAAAAVAAGAGAVHGWLLSLIHI